LKQLARQNHRWKSQQWISSGFDEPTAQRVRGKTFQRAGQQHSTGSLDWLRRLHRSHLPQAGPFSTCMHRADAATVSYAEVAVSSRHATMRYHAGTPCQGSTCSVHLLRLSYLGTVHQARAHPMRVYRWSKASPFLGPRPFSNVAESRRIQTPLWIRAAMASFAGDLVSETPQLLLSGNIPYS